MAADPGLASAIKTAGGLIGAGLALGGGAVGIRSVPAEVGDRDDDRPRRVGEQLLWVDAQRLRSRAAPGDHHDVGGGHHGAASRAARGVRGHRHAALAGIEVAVQRRAGAVRAVGHRRTGGGVPPQPIPLWRLEPADLRPRIDEELSAVAAGYPVADLDDTQVPQWCRPAVGLAPHPAIYSITAKLVKPMEHMRIG